jgi:hypothetical protein
MWNSPTITAIARCVLLHRTPQVPAIHIGPEFVKKNKLGIRALPQQEVADALLTGGAQKQINIGHIWLVQVFGEGALIHTLGVETTCLNVGG